MCHDGHTCREDIFALKIDVRTLDYNKMYSCKVVELVLQSLRIVFIS